MSPSSNLDHPISDKILPLEKKKEHVEPVHKRKVNGHSVSGLNY